jgi:hypothetical protein
MTRNVNGRFRQFTIAQHYGPGAGCNYFADLRMTFRQNFFLQDWFRNKFGVVLG